MNNALGLGLHPLMPTSVLLKVPSASHSPMRFSLPNVTLCYFVLECSWSRNHHNLQSYVCISDLTLSSSFLQILLFYPANSPSAPPISLHPAWGEQDTIHKVVMLQ